jgi:hypothetical protein
MAAGVVDQCLALLDQHGLPEQEAGQYARSM